MAAVAVLRNDSLQAFLQDRTPSASPDLAKHSPLALLAATCSRIGQPGAAPSDFLPVSYDPTLGSPSRIFHPWSGEMPAHSPGGLPPPHPSLGLTPQKNHLQPSFGGSHELPLTPPADPSYPYEFSPVKMLPSSMAALPSSCPPAYVPYAAQAALPPGYSNLLPPAQPCRQLSPNPPPEEIPWWSIQQASAPGGCGHRFPAAAALPRSLVLGHSDFAQYQTQIAALLQTKSPLAATARRCRRCRCPNCQSAAGSAPEAEPGKKKQHICHIPGCGKVYGKTS
ncbi:SP5 factor, partial [Brachypodius atriceps]|nr:SP5 factor [Brachypodius atriceps]